MSKIGEILINATRQKMDFHKRNASGKASQSLKEVSYSEGIRIMGVDYFSSIFDGVKAGGSLTLNDLNAWAKAKQKKYGVGRSSAGILKRILEGNAVINSEPERLHIDKQVLKETKTSISIEARKQINKKVRLWI
tara:strand:- start:1094 stop:1498 length:405 start_codon:yes stop_codon:yes gene_type:complete